MKCFPIKDVLSLLSQRVSVVAVILEYSFPKTTRGTDYCCVLRIVDQSHHETDRLMGNIISFTVKHFPLLPYIKGKIVMILFLIKFLLSISVQMRTEYAYTNLENGGLTFSRMMADMNFVCLKKSRKGIT